MKENPSTNLEKKYTSPYTYFNFQQIFFYDIFFAQCVFYELSVVKVYVYTTVLDRHKIQDSGRVLPYLLSNEARLAFNVTCFFFYYAKKSVKNWLTVVYFEKCHRRKVGN